MLNIKNVLILLLALAFFIVGCGQDQGQQTNESVSKQSDSILDEGKNMMQQAGQEASQLKDSMAKQADEIAAKGSEMLDKAKSEAESLKEDTAAIVEDLITKSKTYFDKGKFNEAIASAQEILTNYDSNFQKAKDIINTATEKLKAMAAEKAKAVMEAASAAKAEEELEAANVEKEAEALESTATEKVEGVKSGLTDKLKSLGQ